jgi:alpha-ribazole phosphatase/probable phosphoglycerate mutase
MQDTVADNRPWHVIITSPLQRCAAFAETLSRDIDVPLHVDERFREIGFGSWEGQTSKMLTAADPGCIQRFRRDPVGERPSGAEALAAFEQRVSAGWQDCQQRHRGQHVLLVAHAGVVRMLLSHTLHIPVTHMFRIHVPNAGLTRFYIEHSSEYDMVRLQFHGRHRVPAAQGNA